VCGLSNPHAGEGGHMGTEENRYDVPVLDRLPQRRHDPFKAHYPADTLFTPNILDQA